MIYFILPLPLFLTPIFIFTSPETAEVPETLDEFDYLPRNRVTDV
jgi:hypothetical protein